jgi:hypothetical protein
MSCVPCKAIHHVHDRGRHGRHNLIIDYGLRIGFQWSVWHESDFQAGMSQARQPEEILRAHCCRTCFDNYRSRHSITEDATSIAFSGIALFNLYYRNM